MPFPQAINNRMQSLAGLGRGGDTAMAHMTPGEVVVPLSITRMYPELVNAISDAIRARGRNPADFIVGAPGGNVNPMTGAEEFFDSAGGDGPGGSGGGSGDGGGGGMGGGDGGGMGGGSDTEGSPGHDASGGFGGGVGGPDPGFGGGDFGGPGFGPAGPAAPPGSPDREGQAGGPGAPAGRGPDVSPSDVGFSPADFGFNTPQNEMETLNEQFGKPPAERLNTGLPDDFFDTPQPKSPVSRVEGPTPTNKSQTAVDKEVSDKAKAGQPGLGEAMMETTKEMAKPSIPGLVGTLTGLLNPTLGMLGTIGRFGYGVAEKMSTPEEIGYHQSQTPDMAPSAPPGGPLGGGSADYAQAVAGKLSSGLQKGQMGVPGIMDMGRTVGPVPGSTGPLPPQDAARIADQLGVSNDALQARAQIATYALNANGADFRTPEAAALWETLLAQSYSPNPGLLDIERQYMAQVLGFGDQAYEGEDQAAFTLAGTGAPIRRSQVAV